MNEYGVSFSTMFRTNGPPRLANIDLLVYGHNFFQQLCNMLLTEVACPSPFLQIVFACKLLRLFAYKRAQRDLQCLAFGTFCQDQKTLKKAYFFPLLDVCFPSYYYQGYCRAAKQLENRCKDQSSARLDLICQRITQV